MSWWTQERSSSNLYTMFMYSTWSIHPSTPWPKGRSELQDPTRFWWYKNNITLDPQLLVFHLIQVGFLIPKVASACYTLYTSSTLIIKIYQILSIIIMAPNLINLFNSQNLQNFSHKGKFGFCQNTSPTFGSIESYISYPIFPLQK